MRSRRYIKKTKGLDRAPIREFTEKELSELTVEQVKELNEAEIKKLNEAMKKRMEKLRVEGGLPTKMDEYFSRGEFVAGEVMLGTGILSDKGENRIFLSKKLCQKPETFKKLAKLNLFPCCKTPVSFEGYKFNYRDLPPKSKKVVNTFFNISGQPMLDGLDPYEKLLWAHCSNQLIGSSNFFIYCYEEKNYDKVIHHFVYEKLFQCVAYYLMLSGKAKSLIKDDKEYEYSEKEITDFENLFIEEAKEPHWQFINEQLYAILKKSYSLEVVKDQRLIMIEQGFYGSLKAMSLGRQKVLGDMFDVAEFRNNCSIIDNFSNYSPTRQEKLSREKKLSHLTSLLKTETQLLTDKETPRDYPRRFLLGALGAFILGLSIATPTAISSGLSAEGALFGLFAEAILTFSLVAYSFGCYYSHRPSPQYSEKKLLKIVRNLRDLDLKYYQMVINEDNLGCGEDKESDSIAEEKKAEEYVLPRPFVPYRNTITHEQFMSDFSCIVPERGEGEKVKTRPKGTVSNALDQLSDRPSSSISKFSVTRLDEGKESKERSVEYEDKNGKRIVKLYDIEGTNKMWIGAINEDKLQLYDEEYYREVMDIIKNGKRVKSAFRSSGLKMLSGGQWELKTMGEFGDRRLLLESFSIPGEDGGTVLIVNLDPSQIKDHEEVARAM
ncbi:MAG: hypothetical protein K0R25_402 [Rickettsiaceae bacterium]|jgi:hypothetical protein|nr:hypothetical protein [Rickettsiaceae bacterium]